MNQPVRNLTIAGLELSPLTPTIGAEVSGVDLTKPLDPRTVAAMRAALLDWKVLFFRDQDITTEQHLAFARNFGDLEVHPFAPHKPDFPEVLAITHDRESRGRENAWHSDLEGIAFPGLDPASNRGPAGGRRHTVRRHVRRL